VEFHPAGKGNWVNAKPIKRMIRADSDRAHPHLLS